MPPSLLRGSERRALWAALGSEWIKLTFKTASGFFASAKLVALVFEERAFLLVSSAGSPRQVTNRTLSRDRLLVCEHPKTFQNRVFRSKHVC